MYEVYLPFPKRKRNGKAKWGFFLFCKKETKNFFGNCVSLGLPWRGASERITRYNGFHRLTSPYYGSGGWGNQTQPVRPA